MSRIHCDFGFHWLSCVPKWVLFSINVGLALGMIPIAWSQTDVTSEVEVARVRQKFNRITRISYLDMTLTNISSNPLPAPIQLVFSNLPAGVTVNNATGNTPEGDALIDFLTKGQLEPGQRVSFRVQFLNPKRVRITFDSIVLSGAGGESPIATLNNPQTLEDEPAIFALTGFDPEDGDETHLTVTLANQSPGTPASFMMFQVEPDNVSQGAFIPPLGSTEVTNPERLVMYVPSLDFAGLSQFFYRVEDSDGHSDVAQVFVEVIEVNDPPFPSPFASDHASTGSASVFPEEPTTTRVTLIWGDVDSTNYTVTITELPDTGQLYRTDDPGGISPQTLVTSGNATFPVSETQNLLFHYVSTPMQVGAPFTTFMWTVSDGEFETSEILHTINIIQRNQPPDPGPFPTDIVTDETGVLLEFNPTDADGPYEQIRLLIKTLPEHGELFLVDGLSEAIVGVLAVNDVIPPSCFLGDCAPFYLLYVPDPEVELEGLPPTDFTFLFYDAFTTGDQTGIPVQTVTIHF